MVSRQGKERKCHIASRQEQTDTSSALDIVIVMGTTGDSEVRSIYICDKKDEIHHDGHERRRDKNQQESTSKETDTGIMFSLTSVDSLYTGNNSHQQVRLW